MATPQAAPRPILCDGCALEAGPAHLRQRIARLEWASRFRPIHIGTLLLAPAPARDLEDYFYFPVGMPRHPAARAFVEDVFAACGMPSVQASREPALRAFQHRGFFVAHCVECPLEPRAPADFPALLQSLMPTLVRRVRVSYRPKSVLLLSGLLGPVAESFAACGLASSLVGQGLPLELPDPADDAARECFRSRLASLLPAS
ncbi:MAG TPA: hypothetical protein VGS20_16140 [Candidatus Acidoferrales bacterium]|nr:hypothetical protein [Candidatus Acidoferrales bacterium]